MSEKTLEQLEAEFAQLLVAREEALENDGDAWSIQEQIEEMGAKILVARHAAQAEDQ
jgi:hypothetical protein